MTEKQQLSLSIIIDSLPDECRESYREIAEFAVSLGYMPVIKGTRKDYADFSKSKVKRTILKINTHPDYRGLSMKFYALPDYSGIFKSAVEARFATWNRLGYEARCFGCGKCDSTEGYSFDMPDGTRGFLCGFGVLPLPEFNAENIPEVKNALKMQDEFFMKQVLT